MPGPSPRRAPPAALAIGCLSALIAVALAPGARADLRVDGRWRQGPLREDFTVQQWLNGCGPAPHSSSTGGGELVTMRLEGDELSIVGGGRVYRTNQCYDPMPTLSRESHSRDPSGKSWRTRCATSASDPRKALLNTLVVATSDTRVDVLETGRYEIVLETGRCMADVKRTRTFDRIQEDAPKPAVSAPIAIPTQEPKAPACGVLGEPARLEVRPSQKLLRTGESFQFRAAVLDESGCATRSPTTWKLAQGAEGKGVTVDGSGRVTVAADAPEGKIELVASAAGKDARVSVEVTLPGRYEELVASRGLNASGENDAASVVSMGGQSLGAGEGRVEDRARSRRLTFVAIIGGVLVVLTAAGLVLLRRSRRAAQLERDADERHEARVRAVRELRRARADQHAAQLRAHEQSVQAARAAESAPSVASKPPNVCPICALEFEAPTSFCPHDGTALVAASKASTVAMPSPAAIAKAAPAKRGKICPTCGDRFDGGADFCGKDGTALVLIN